MNDWISVEDALPEDGQTVDVVVKYTEGYVRFTDAVYSTEADYQWEHDYLGGFDNVTHWQPTPKLPEKPE